MVNRQTVSVADSQMRKVLSRAQTLYGELSNAPEGVIHTVSAVRAASGRLHVIKIQQGAPPSSTDGFVLRYWRAHYDAVITTGKVVRAEPTLSYAPQGELAQGLMRYRSQVLGKSEPLRCVILTRSADLPADHPIFVEAHAGKPLVLTLSEKAPRLRRALRERAQVVEIESLDVRRAVAYLQREGAAAIGIEAGPSVASELYRAPMRIDHLMLSVCEAAVAAEIVGGQLPADAELFGALQLVSDVSCDEESGPWRFQHWQRFGTAHTDKRAAASRPGAG